MRISTKNADYCMLANEWLKLQVCLLRLEVGLGSFVGSEVDRKEDTAHGALKASITFATLILQPILH